RRRGLGGRWYQSHRSVFSFRSVANAQATSTASLSGLLSPMFGKASHFGSSGGSLVTRPAPVLFSQQLLWPSWSHQKSTPLGSTSPSGETPITLPSWRLRCEVEILRSCGSSGGRLRLFESASGTVI